MSQLHPDVEFTITAQRGGFRLEVEFPGPHVWIQGGRFPKRVLLDPADVEALFAIVDLLRPIIASRKSEPGN